MGESRRSFLKRPLLAENCKNASTEKNGSITKPAKKGSNSPTSTLVCVFLRGGADTLNMIPPYGDSQYYKVRPTIAIPKPGTGKNAALKLDDFFGLHPKLKGLAPIFSAGELGFMQAVGSDNPTGSHFEAQDQMEHGECYGKSIGGGWLGRYLRSKANEMLTPLSAVAIGSAVPESFRGAPVISVIRKIEEMKMSAPSGSSEAICRALESLYSGEAAGILGPSGKTTLDLLKRVERLQKHEYKPANQADYKDNEFANGLKEIARLVKASLGLEVACIDLGGWDTHFVQGGAEGQQAALIEQLGDGLHAFWKDLGSLNKDVSTIVMTEFGRRTYENGSLGTDHGRGFTLMAIGAGVNGGKVHGIYPGLEDDQYELGPGGLRITSDYRNVLAEVLSYHCADISEVFPGLELNESGFFRKRT